MSRKHLFKVGREVLVKVIAQCILTYHMSAFLFSSFEEELEQKKSSSGGGV